MSSFHCSSVLLHVHQTFEDFDSLEDVLACFYEALRLFPAAYIAFREAERDTAIKLLRNDGSSTMETMTIKKGTMLILDWIGMSYDPTVFPDPERFDPYRWTKSKNPSEDPTPTTEATHAGEVSISAASSSLDGFPGFSFGPRTCLGHKFAKVEAVAFLTLVLREWRVEVTLEEGETREAWRKRVLDPTFNTTMKFGQPVPIKLVRRSL